MNRIVPLILSALLTGCQDKKVVTNAVATMESKLKSDDCFKPSLNDWRRYYYYEQDKLEMVAIRSTNFAPGYEITNVRTFPHDEDLETRVVTAVMTISDGKVRTSCERDTQTLIERETQK